MGGINSLQVIIFHAVLFAERMAHKTHLAKNKCFLRTFSWSQFQEKLHVFVLSRFVYVCDKSTSETFVRASLVVDAAVSELFLCVTSADVETATTDPFSGDGAGDPQDQTGSGPPKFNCKSAPAWSHLIITRHGCLTWVSQLCSSCLSGSDWRLCGPSGDWWRKPLWGHSWNPQLWAFCRPLAWRLVVCGTEEYMWHWSLSCVLGRMWVGTSQGAPGVSMPPRIDSGSLGKSPGRLWKTFVQCCAKRQKENLWYNLAASLSQVWRKGALVCRQWM